MYIDQLNAAKDWKAKLESAYSLILKYSKITVHAIIQLQDLELKIFS